MKVSRVSEMRELDRTAIEEFGIVEELLMENAGLAVYSVISEEFGIKDRKFLVFCGIGNNGGGRFCRCQKDPFKWKSLHSCALESQDTPPSNLQEPRMATG